MYYSEGEAEISAVITPIFLMSHDLSEIILICWFVA